MEKLLTLGQLLQMKREQLGLNRTEAEQRIGVGHYVIHKYEKDLIKPTKKTLNKLISFYKITDLELKSLKSSNKYSGENKKQRIEETIRVIDSIIDDLSVMQSRGAMANKLKNESKDELTKARSCLVNVSILDHLL